MLLRRRSLFEISVVLVLVVVVVVSTVVIIIERVASVSAMVLSVLSAGSGGRRWCRFPLANGRNGYVGIDHGKVDVIFAVVVMVTIR